MQIGHGETTTEEVSRFALLGDIGFEIDPLKWLAVRLDAAFGWQVLWGQLLVGGTPVNGPNAQGLRLELAPAVGIHLWSGLWGLVRGGLAVDGTYSDKAPSSTQATGFFHLALQYRL
jgi:hypothetical protein